MTNPDTPLDLDDRARALYSWDARIRVLTALDEAQAALAAVTAERDEARQFEARVWQRIQTWNDNPQTRLEAFAITHEHVAAAREQAKQAQAELTEARDLLRTIWYGTVNAPARERWQQLMAGATSTAAPKADAECGCPIEHRTAAITRHTRECHMAKVASDFAASMEDEPLPAAVPDPADDDELTPVLEPVNRADLVAIAAIGAMPSVPDLSLPLDDECTCDLNLRKVCDTCAAGGEDGSGTADGEVPA